VTRTVYLDFAATSAVRPPEVIEAVTSYLRNVGATPGRSGHARALAAGRIALECRRLLAELIGFGGDPGRITFHLNATYALNTAIFGLVRAGDRVIRTRYDHNAVRRPIAAIGSLGVAADVLDIGPDGRPDLVQLERLLREGDRPTRFVAIPHASNVTGQLLPIREVSDLAHEYGALVLVDAAQSLGHYPVDIDTMGADLLAFTGHKGVPGPQGVGGLWTRPGVEVRPLAYGGTGGDSDPFEMPDAYPDHLEAGTQNAVGIAGLAAAARWVLGQGVDHLHRTEKELKKRLVAGLGTIPGVTICGASATSELGIVSVLLHDMDAAELTTRIEREHGIQGRGGLHCAPDAHEWMGTLGSGAFRLSLGWATTAEEIDYTINAFRALSESS
jgi:cysteine desulfurase/selenocysteine lyase